MKTLELYSYYTEAKRLSDYTRRNYNRFAQVTASLYPEWFDNSLLVDRFMKSVQEQHHYNDVTLRQLFRFLHALGNFGSLHFDLKNPCTKATRIIVKKKNRRYFTAKELSAILNSCSTPYDKAIILTLIDSACRIGELVNLKGSDVLDNAIKVTGKTGQHIYRLDSKICLILKKLAGNDDNLVFPKTGHDPRVITTDTNGTTRTSKANAISLHVRQIMIRAGIKGTKIGAHTLRHTSASLIARETGSLLIVQSLLQHENQQMSQIYLHDVSSELAQKYSPLAILSSQLQGSNVNIKQQPLAIPEHTSSSKEIIIADNNPDIDPLLETGFQAVPENIAIRPRLNSDDLNLIRRAFIAVSSNGALNDGSLARHLFRRILRLKQ